MSRFKHNKWKVREGSLDDLLENKNRKKIVMFLREDAGSTIKEISDSTDVRPSEVYRHLHLLERGGYVVEINKETLRYRLAAGIKESL